MYYYIPYKLRNRVSYEATVQQWYFVLFLWCGIHNHGRNS